MNKKFIILGVFIILLVVYGIIVRDRDTKEEKVDLSYLNLPPDIVYFSFSGVLEYYFSVEPEFTINNIYTERQKNKFDKDLRKKLIELLNMPFKVSDEKVRVTETVDKGTYTQKNLIIPISKSIVAQAYLLTPKGDFDKKPLIIAMHQHGGFYDFGKEEVAGNKGDSNMFYGKELAERGYVVFVMDAPLFGAETEMSFTNSREIAEQFSAQGLFALGHSPLGVVVQRDLIALDYLNSLDFVDENKIGCIGHSFGGVRCMYLSALDERIKVTVLSNSVGNLRFNQDGIVHTWFTLLPGAAKYTETNGILGLIAPRPLMIVYSEKDPIFPKQDAESQIQAVNELYKRLNKENNFKTLLIKEDHSFPKKYHEEVYLFLDKNLKN